MSQTTLGQHGNHANVNIRKWNVYVITSTRKNDQGRITKDASFIVQTKSFKTKEVKETCEIHERNEKDRKKTTLFVLHKDEDIDKRDKDEDKIELIRPREAEDHMKKKTNVPCWMETHRKWRMSMGIASLLQQRWTSKIIDCHPGLVDKIKTNRSVGRPRKRLKDENNEKLGSETEATGNDLKNSTLKTPTRKSLRKKKKHSKQHSSNFGGNGQKN